MRVERDWMRLIDKRAAVKEQFPTLQRLMRERPGSLADRENRALFEVENRESLARARLVVTRRQAVEADADRFIAEMRRRERERFLDRLAARRQQDNDERKTA